jgi:hypothetical protein
MNLLAAAALGALALLAFLARRSALFPPVLLAGGWAVALLLLNLPADVFYPIGDGTRLFYVVAAAVFLLGGIAGSSLLRGYGTPPPARVEWDTRRLGFLLDFLIVVLLIALPVYWRELQAAARQTAIENLLIAARVRSLRSELGLGTEIPWILSILGQMSIAFTFVAFAPRARSPWWHGRRTILFLLSLGLQLTTGGRAGVVALVGGVLGIVWIGERRVRVAVVLPLLVAMLLTSAFVAIQLEKGLVRRAAGLRGNVPALVADLQWYALGPVVGFDRVLREPDALPSTGGVGRTVAELANSFGADIEIPPRHAQYTTVGDFREVNAYTAYYWYLGDLGIPGAMFFIWLAGLVTTLAFEWAWAGSLGGRVVYGVAFAGVGQSVYSEALFTNVNFVAKSLIVLAALYWIAGRARDRPPAEGAA